MADLRVKTKLGVREVKRRFSSLPKIIAGQQPDPANLRPFFFAIFARRLYQLIYAAFKIKSLGGSDSLGNNWRSLKPATVRRRKQKSFLAKYPASAKMLINRVTDRLLNSLAAGSISGFNYIPTREQKYLLESKRLILGSDVPYSNHAHRLRRLWPARMKAWIQDATNMALDRTLIRLAKSLP